MCVQVIFDNFKSPHSASAFDVKHAKPIHNCKLRTPETKTLKSEILEA